MRLLGHELFPTHGSIFVPSYLRILFVSREPSLLLESPWANLVFGCTPEDIDIARVRKILKLMRIPEDLVAKELTNRDEATNRVSTDMEEEDDDEDIDDKGLGA